MIKEKRGTKRLCEGCEKKFYDLGRDPIVCPMCETTFIVEKPKPKPKPRAAPAPAPAPAPAEAAPAPAPEPEPTEPAAAPAEEAVPVAKDDAAVVEPELVSLDEAAEEEEVDDEAKLADLGDDVADIPPDDNPDVFIEEDEEDGESNVTEIIGTPIESKDET